MEDLLNCIDKIEDFEAAHELLQKIKRMHDRLNHSRIPQKKVDTKTGQVGKNNIHVWHDFREKAKEMPLFFRYPKKKTRVISLVYQAMKGYDVTLEKVHDHLIEMDLNFTDLFLYLEKGEFPWNSQEPLET
jgi:hypothetical protein